MAESRAIAQVEGEIANKIPLSVSPGGLCVTNIKVEYEGNSGPIPNYIPVKWFKPESESIVERFQTGDRVSIVAHIKMRKEKGQQFYGPQLIGIAAKPASEDDTPVIAAMKAAFDAKSYEDVSLGDDDIPF